MRGVVPPSKAGLLIIAATVAPIFVKKLRPAVKRAGEGLVKAGEFVQRMAEEAKAQPAEAKGEAQIEETAGAGTSEGDAAPNGDVNENTTKVGAEAAGTEVTTASPTGHEEMERQAAVEAMGDGAVTEPAPPASRKERKTLEPDQKLNPKRQKNSRPD